MVIRVAATAGWATGIALTVLDAYDRVKSGQSKKELIGGIGESFIGINFGAPNRAFRPWEMRFTVPAAIGSTVSYAACKLGANKNNAAKPFNGVCW